MLFLISLGDNVDNVEDNRKEKEKHKETEQDIKKKISDKTLIIAISMIILLLLIIFSLKIFMEPEEPETIEDLHLLNLQGKLEPEQGYIYNGYSFVNYDNFWYTQIKSPNGLILYSLMFRFGPREVSDIEIKGKLNATLFDSSNEYYATFNPLGRDFSHVAAAVNDFNQNMLKAFKKTPIAACDKNETLTCKTRPIITCSNTNKLVFYVNESETTGIIFDNNCIVVNGNGLELIRAVDKLILTFYGIIEQ